MTTVPKELLMRCAEFLDMTKGYSTEELGHMVCGKCGHEAGWMCFSTRSEVKRGAPCPICNEGEQQ